MSWWFVRGSMPAAVQKRERWSLLVLYAVAYSMIGAIMLSVFMIVGHLLRWVLCL